MTGALKDSYKLSLLAAVLFLASVLVSGYFLYALPHDAVLDGSMSAAFIKTYIAVAISFILAGLALYLAMRSQREIVVYRDKVIDGDKTDNTSADETKTTITLEGVISAIQHARNEKDLLTTYLQVVCKQLEAGRGALYLVSEKEGTKVVELKGGYALNISENNTITFDFGEGLIGQCAVTKSVLYVDDVPEGYIKIISGLGSASPQFLLIAPIVQGEEIKGVLEIASFTPITQDQRRFIEESIKLLSEKISKLA